MAQHTEPVKVKMTAQYVIEQYLPGLSEVASAPYPGKLAFVVYKNLRLARKVETKFDKARIAILDRYAERDEKGELQHRLDENGKPTLQISLLEGMEEAFNNAVMAEFRETVYEVEVYTIGEASIMDMASVRPAALEAISPMLITEEDKQPTEAAEEASEHEPELQQ
jgi:meiotically up-regulated gene 157 (Mug157) protein